MILPNSVTETFNIETLKITLITIIIVFYIVLVCGVKALRMLSMLLAVHVRSLIVVHLVVHVVWVCLSGHLHGILLLIVIEQLHENLVMVIEPFSLNLLSPCVIMLLHVIQNGVH